MSKAEERLDKYHKAILQYVKERPGQTENQIVKEMHDKKVSSLRTTLKKIAELKEMGEIEDLLKEGESGFHKLYIVDKGQFKSFEERLKVIEETIYKYKQIRKSLDKDQNPESIQIIIKLIYYFELSFQNIFYFMFPRIYLNVPSDKDKVILYNKIVEMMLETSHVSYRNRIQFEYIFADTINKIEDFQRSEQFLSICKKYNLRTDLYDSVIQIMKKFLVAYPG